MALLEHRTRGRRRREGGLFCEGHLSSKAAGLSRKGGGLSRKGGGLSRKGGLIEVDPQSVPRRPHHNDRDHVPPIGEIEELDVRLGERRRLNERRRRLPLSLPPPRRGRGHWRQPHVPSRPTDGAPIPPLVVRDEREACGRAGGGAERTLILQGGVRQRGLRRAYHTRQRSRDLGLIKPRT